MNIKATIKYALAASTLLAIASVGGLFAIYKQLGYSPRELMDYSERRLQGHPKLEFIALPILAMARDWLDSPSAKERMKTVFHVPPPPPLALRPIRLLFWVNVVLVMVIWAASSI